MEIRSKGIFGKYGKTTILLLGTVFISLGFTLLLQFNALYDYVIESAMEFSPESESFKAWRINDPPLILDIYLFNWTNAEDINNASIKPRFEQVGPYKFLETKEKVNITWHSNKTVSYKYIKRYYYMEDESPRKLTDEITTINHVALTTAYQLRHSSFLLRLSLSMTLFSLSPVYITKTANELLFEGYRDHILNTGGFVKQGVPDRFGFFYKRNGTVSSDLLSMYIGVDKNFGRLLTCNNKNSTPYYNGKCGEIRGSAGEFHPMDSKPSFIDVYSAEICTHAHLEYERNVTVKGINAYKYSSRMLFDNGTLNPENACFCNGECIPTGVLNVSSCRQNSPTFISMPHFFNADPYYTSLVDGLHPEKEKHELYITLEPKSSITIDLALRIQANMLLQPIKGIRQYADVPRVFIPLFFFDQNVTISDELAEKIKEVQNLPDMAKKASIGMIISGGVGVGISLLLFVFVRDKKDKVVEIKKVSYTYDDIPLSSEHER